MTDTSGLLPYQIAPAEGILAALRRYGAALDASETGTGKTYVAMAVCRELGIAPLVLCPKSVCSAWHRVAEFMGGSCVAINYEKLRTGKTPYGRWHEVRKGATVFQFDPEECPPVIIFDEGHRCKAQNSLNAKMMIAARRQGFTCIVASATIADNPLHMKALGYMLDLHDGKNFWKFARMYGCRPANFGGLMFTGGLPTLQRLHAHIFPERGVRVRRDQLGDAFPESQITAELCDLEDADQIDALYAEMEEALSALKDKMADDADLEHPLTKLLRARQKVELLKVPVFEELIRDGIEDGMSIAVFLNFSESIEQLLTRLGDKLGPISVIQGGQFEEERDQMIAEFQSGHRRICLANIKAGGVGVSLHDMDGKFPRLSLISPTFSAIDLVQTLGRVWRQDGRKAGDPLRTKSLQRILLAAGTVEEKIYKKLQHKLANLSLINDGDLRTVIT